MACTSCRDRISGVCKVCELVDKDSSVKVVTFCDFCGVYICKECNGNILKRFEAFVKAKI